ncbi:kelch-like protein 14 [Mercenaria mercenaria]|uniref:kelch-like protein 14 n=1 Tax=Mercenaria mercenaria TaxID=6596 RepID=UPI00234F5814|nr:kelch-like protein 14 [Mercenaria mercenaria]
MPTENGATFIEKIQAKRVYADCPIASDNSDKSPRSSTADSQEEMPTDDGRTDTSRQKHKSTARNLHGKNGEKSKWNECYEGGNFATMVAEHQSDSGEENDKVNPCIDITNANFKLPLGKEQPLTNEHAETISDLPCDIFFLDEKATLQKFETFDQISGYLVHASVHAKNENTQRNHFQKLVQIPLRQAEHLITLGEYLSQLYEDEKLIDVEIDIQGRTFFAHRIALCCNSEYFLDFFNRNKSNTVPFVLKIKGVTVDAFAAFLEFCYTGEITVFPETSADIIVMAEFLKVDTLRDRCDEVAKSLPLDQSLKMLVKTKSRSTGKLYNALFNKVLGEFKAASMLDNFFKMDVELLCRLLMSDELIAASEFEVFTIAIRWIVHDVESRVKYTMRILSLIRFYCMTQLELLMCGETTSLVRGYDKFREMILVANWMKTADNLKRDDPFQFSRPKPRLCFLNPAKTVTKSDHEPKQASDLTLMMPPPLMTSTPKPTPRPKRPSSNENVNASNCVDIFVVGGFVADESKQQSKFVEKYDVVDNQWLHFLPSARTITPPCCTSSPLSYRKYKSALIFSHT